MSLLLQTHLARTTCNWLPDPASRERFSAASAIGSSDRVLTRTTNQLPAPSSPGQVSNSSTTTSAILGDNLALSSTAFITSTSSLFPTFHHLSQVPSRIFAPAIYTDRLPLPATSRTAQPDTCIPRLALCQWQLTSSSHSFSHGHNHAPEPGSNPASSPALQIAPLKKPWSSENHSEVFRRLLAPTSYNAQAISKSPAIGGGGGFLGGSPGGLGSSPRAGAKPRRASGYPQTPGKTKDANTNLGRAEVNSRDHAGLTVLLRAASSTEPNARDFVQALLQHAAIDLYVQDLESGWNALHRSLYVGNVSIARLLLEKERVDLTSHNLSSVSKVGLLIKTKDHEGNSPFDLYNSTIALRSLKNHDDSDTSDSDSDSADSGSDMDDGYHAPHLFHGNAHSVNGDELFMFGSNKNLSLGVGDEDDRQYPERIHLRRPDQLLKRFHHSYLAHQDVEASMSLPGLDDIPTLIRNRPLVIQDVVLSKLHSAILTTDPVSNLYVCGVGRGGRLGLGDENTKFKFVPVQGPLADKKIRHVALGQNHTMAIAGNGELWTWGLNSNSQLGYALPPPARADEEPMSLAPRQVFGSLKKELVLGIAASANHSVAHTGSSLYCWGRNVGQLALMDADSRSLDFQSTPRKVAASLLASTIVMVSAIDKATTCLLANHTVWVFAEYGYNLVKFVVPDLFSNYKIATTFHGSHYDPRSRDIAYITSGGDTIAAVTSRGDLFTLRLNHKGELSQSDSSTTNPVKIKGALTQPQCIWDSRKDGVTSVGVGEHGSVMICTQSGAVWKRVQRTKGKMAGFADPTTTKRKDFKFQRVPYITNCVSVRSSMFGAFAAIRKNSKVVAEEIEIDKQTVWKDVGALLCLTDFEPPHRDKIQASEPPWKAIARQYPHSVAHNILLSDDIEADLLHWLQVNSFQFGDRDVEVCTSSLPDAKIPVHGWVLAARSPVLREALYKVRTHGSNYATEHFTIDLNQEKITLTLLGFDVYTLLNLVLYAYQDSMVSVWRYTRQIPKQAFRFRQVRSEVMKVATFFTMPKLEAAVRLQTLTVEQSLDTDFKEAISHPHFFGDADVILELDGADVMVHSQLMCQRCPFFEGLFHGRSQGQWLASRRDDLGAMEKIRIDLKHVNPETFQYAIAYIYADVGHELFDEVAVATIDDLSDLVLDVMSVANELMLDRLSQICQSLIGKFVTTRNISNLLNEISPCSVTEFKDAGLEYICLQLETMLENHLLDDLDEELLLDLDAVIRENQLARLPIARSGRSEMLLHEMYPHLAGDIDEERQVRIREMAYKSTQRDEDKKLSSSFKARIGSLDGLASTPTPDQSRRRSMGVRNEPFSPSLRPRQSQGDLIFDMDEEEVSGKSTPRSPGHDSSGPGLADDTDKMPQLPKAWRDQKGKAAADTMRSPVFNSSLPDSMSLDSVVPRKRSTGPIGSSASASDSPWASSTLTMSKLDLKDIMSEASSKSALTSGITEQKTTEAANHKALMKMSQKERKKQLQMQTAAQSTAKDELDKMRPWVKAAGEDERPAPWKTVSLGSKTSLKDVLPNESRMPRAVSAIAKPLVASETRPQSKPQRTASPDTRFAGQGRTSSSPAIPTRPAEQVKQALVPHSKSYMTPAPKAEATLGFSMSDIIGQQRREQELVKEAVAKRSLQEIQEEQAFQEWWDQESRRAQEEEARRRTKTKDREDKGDKGARRGRRCHA
ncbi:hypothetical protein G7046_g5071 [Stylonectria norvegica]|nr:hypothetical protein G7046_g5071 [Stylonectria norvegica]